MGFSATDPPTPPQASCANGTVVAQKSVIAPLPLPDIEPPAHASSDLSAAFTK